MVDQLVQVQQIPAAVVVLKDQVVVEKLLTLLVMADLDFLRFVIELIYDHKYLKK